jgi:spermidine/putrescine transport system substrate-binding protein
MHDSTAPPVLGPGRMARRDFLRRAGQVGIGVPAAAWLAAACGSSPSATSSSGAVEGTATILNYAGWMGKNNVSSFEALHRGAAIKQVTEASVSDAAIVAELKANMSAFTGTLGDLAVVGQAMVAGMLQPLDWSKIPNISNVESTFKDTYSHGVPSDYGKVGIGYRTDLVKEDITSWHDVWRLAPKYSGKIVFLDLDRDCIGSALKYLGYSTNTTSTAQLNKALKALIAIKPYLQAILSYNVGTGLAAGTTYIAMDWDYDVALAQQSNKNVRWVLPAEGATAYLEGFFALKNTPELPVFESFFNYFLEPKQYADFVNTTGTAFVEKTATPYIDKVIAENPALLVDPVTLSKVEFEDFVGAATTIYNNVWNEFKAAS